MKCYITFVISIFVAHRFSQPSFFTRNLNCQFISLKLYDHENRIAMEAADVLEEACEDEVCFIRNKVI